MQVFLQILQDALNFASFLAKVNLSVQSTKHYIMEV